jgi:hypothetical protein
LATLRKTRQIADLSEGARRCWSATLAGLRKTCQIADLAEGAEGVGLRVTTLFGGAILVRTRDRLAMLSPSPKLGNRRANTSRLYEVVKDAGGRPAIVGSTTGRRITVAQNP